MTTDRKHETPAPAGWYWPALRYPGEPEVLLIGEHDRNITCSSENRALALRAAADEWFRLHPEAGKEKTPPSVSQAGQRKELR